MSSLFHQPGEDVGVTPLPSLPPSASTDATATAVEAPLPGVSTVVLFYEKLAVISLHFRNMFEILILRCWFR